MGNSAIKRHELLFAPMVQESVFYVDDFGQIWRGKYKSNSGGGRGHSSYRYVSCPPRRAEHFTGKYLQVLSNIDGRKTGCMAHRLVWFILEGEIPEGMEINHRDGNKINNRPDNLELLTPGDNQRHAIKNGWSIYLRGENARAARFTNEIIDECKRLRASGETLRSISEKTGVSSSQISRVIHEQSRAQP